MSPEDLKQHEDDLLSEFEQQMKCLAALNERLRDMGHPLHRLAIQLQGGESPSPKAFDDNLPKITKLAEAHADYRATRSRCVELRERLVGFGYAHSVADITLPDR